MMSYIISHNQKPVLLTNQSFNQLLPIRSLGHLLLCDVDIVPNHQFQLIRLTRHMRIQHLRSNKIFGIRGRHTYPPPPPPI
jgi:hypothetical protein